MRAFKWGTAGAVLGIHIAMLLGPIWGISVAVAHFVLYVFVLAPTFNALRHWSRRKNFLTNNATNLRVLAWLTSGERLRNNHHAYPSSPKFSTGRFEFDPSGVVIKMLLAFRLVSLIGERVKLT